MRRRVILAGLAVAALALLLLLSPWRSWLLSLLAWLRTAGGAGAVALVLGYAVGSVLALPTWPLTVVAGAAYGVWRGFPLALLGCVAGASLAFVAGRTLFREGVARRVARDPRLAAMDEAVSRQGAFLVLLLRLSPLAPANVVNYALSASRIGPGAFAGASLVGMAPLVLAWTWAGATFGSLEGMAGGAPAGPLAQGVRWGGLVATVAVVILLGRIARRASCRMSS